jgi:O-antigen/teichoic acid export membrane protein
MPRTAASAMQSGTPKNAAAWAFVAQASVALVTLPVTFMLARALSPTGLGSFQLLNRLALIAISVAHLGYPHAFAWAAGRARSRVEVRALFRRAVVLSSLQGAGVLGIALIAGAAGFHPGGQVAWLLIACYPLFNVLAANFASIFRGSLAIPGMAAIRISQAIAWCALTTALYATNRLTVTSAVAVLLVSQFLSVVVAFAWSAARGLLMDPARVADAPALRKFSLRVFPGLTIRDWNIYLDQIIVGFAFSRHALGIYSVAVALTVALGMLASPFVNTAQPVIQRAAPLMRLEVASRLLAAAVGLLVLAAGSLALVAPVIVPWLYGGRFAASVALVQILCLAAVFDVVNAAMHGILLGLDRPGQSSRATVFGLAANVIGWIVLLPLFGLVGAALTSVLAYFVVTAFMTRAVVNALNCSYRELLFSVLVRMGKDIRSVPHVSGRALFLLRPSADRGLSR